MKSCEPMSKHTQQFAAFLAAALSVRLLCCCNGGKESSSDTQLALLCGVNGGARIFRME